MKVNGNLTLNADGSGVIQNAFIEQFASNPTGVTGRIYYNTTVEAYYYYDGTTWQQFAAGTSAVTSFHTTLSGLTPSSATSGAITLAGTLGVPSGGTGVVSLTTNGVLYGVGASPVGVTAAGSQYNVLTVNGSSVPVFGQVNLAQAAAVTGILGLSNGGTNANLTATAGGFTYGTGTALAVSAAGTAGQFVLSGGASTPTYLTNSTPVDTDGAGTVDLIVGSSFNVFGTANQVTTTAVASPAGVTLSVPSTFIAPGSVEVTTTLKIDGLTYESAQTNITAHAGGGQGSAFQLTKSYNVVTTVATAGDSIKLPASGVGLEITVVNLGSNALAVFPASGDQIDGAAVNASVPVPVGGTATYQSVNAGNWYTIDPVVVSSGAGLSVTYSPGETVLSNTGVTSFQTSLSGLTPSSSTTGAITLAGTLGVPSGGTGATTLTSKGVVVGNGTGTVTVTAAGSQYNVLTVDGSSNPVFGQVNLAQAAAVTGILGLSNGGTNANITASAGAVTYSTASALALNSPGTTGQALISGGTGAPTWQTVAASLTTNQILEGDGTGKFTANGGTFTGSGSFSGVTLNGSVTNPTDAATKAYVDAGSAGLSWKQAVIAATTVNGTLATAFANGSVIDGVTLTTGDRILIKNQTVQTDNGIYIVQASGAPVRSTDANTGVELESAAVFVREGTVNATSAWVQITDPVVIGTDNIVFSQFSGAGTYTAGTALTLTGNQFNVNSDTTTIFVNGSNQLAVNSTATAGQVLRSGGTAGVAATWGAVNLANTSAVTGTLAVGNGGTGATTFTTHGVLVGEGTGAVVATAVGTTGQVLAGNTGADPSFQTLSGLAVTSIAGTANQITASAATGAVTLSLPSTVVLPGSLEVTTTAKFDGLTYQSTAAVSAAGTTQGTATAITSEYNLVTASAGNTGVSLPTPAFAGVEITVVNVSAVDAKVYPATGGTIDGAGTNNAITVPAGGTWTAQASTTTQWYSIDPVVVNGTGISVTYSNGQTSISNTGVLSFSAGTTGLTPSSGTSGNVTLAGTLNLASGGTNASLTASAGSVAYSTASAIAFSAVGTTGYFLTSAGAGAPTWSNPATTVVTSFQTSLSGLTPSSGTTGAVTLAGTLGSTSGGTGVNNSAGAVGTALVASTTGHFTATPISYTATGTITGGTPVALTHGLNMQYVLVQVYDITGTPSQIIPDSIVLTDANTVTVGLNSTLDVLVVVTGIAGVVNATF